MKKFLFCFLVLGLAMAQPKNKRAVDVFFDGEWATTIPAGSMSTEVHRGVVEYDKNDRELEYTYTLKSRAMGLDIEAGVTLRNVVYEDKGDYLVFYGEVYLFNDNDDDRVVVMNGVRVPDFDNKPIASRTKRFGAVYVKRKDSHRAEISLYFPNISFDQSKIAQTFSNPPKETATLSELKLLSEADLIASSKGGVPLMEYTRQRD